VFSAPEEARSREFFRIWTMKESYLKYLGTGIDRSLSSFSVLEELPGVILSNYFLPDACLTLCAQEPLSGVQMLKNREILPENRCL
jgi:phosphopantetheinyl transferase